MTLRSKPILCIDFDGVIHLYNSPWVNAWTIVDGPVPGALQWLWEATKTFQVVIYSSRSKEPAGLRAMRKWLADHSTKEFGPDHVLADDGSEGYPFVFASEKPAAFLTIDDRAILFDGNWGKLDPKELLKFTPWNKK
jgi:hypothetical protein